MQKVFMSRCFPFSSCVQWIAWPLTDFPHGLKMPHHVAKECTAVVFGTH